MGLDARLADPLILAMAAMRARQHQTTAPKRQVTLQVVYYDMLGIEADELGESYTYALPPRPGERPC